MIKEFTPSQELIDSLGIPPEDWREFESIHQGLGFKEYIERKINSINTLHCNAI